MASTGDKPLASPLSQDSRTALTHAPSRIIHQGESHPFERTPYEEATAHIYKAYNFRDYGTWHNSFDGKRSILTDYDPFKLSSSRVLSVFHGTVFMDGVLLIEQIIITVVFFSVAIIPYWIKHVHEHEGKNISYASFVGSQEPRMRAFAMIMSGLAAFLLSFYTSLLVGRWWVMRSQGVGGIKGATVDLEMLISQNVTRDEEVLSAIRRYGRASLMLIFLWRRNELDCLKQVLVTRRELLTADEAEQLVVWKHCWHETIWAWQAAIINTLHAENKIKSDNLYCMLLDKCCQGRAAAQCVHTHIAVRIPMQYVHLLGFLVKSHNFILAIIMGILSGVAYVEKEYIICVQTFGRTFILPFLFNAILLINARLSDPFDGHSASFPAALYEKTLDKDCVGIIEAGDNLPSWLCERRAAIDESRSAVGGSSV